MVNIVIFTYFTLHYYAGIMLMLSMTHYAGITGRSLTGVKEIPKSKERKFSMLYKTAKGKVNRSQDENDY